MTPDVTRLSLGGVPLKMLRAEHDRAPGFRGHGSMGRPHHPGNPEDLSFRVAPDGPAPPLLARYFAIDQDLFHLLVGIEAERTDPVPRLEPPYGKGGRNFFSVKGRPTRIF